MNNKDNKFDNDFKEGFTSNLVDSFNADYRNQKNLELYISGQKTKSSSAYESNVLLSEEDKEDFNSESYYNYDFKDSENLENNRHYNLERPKKKVYFFRALILLAFTLTITVIFSVKLKSPFLEVGNNYSVDELYSIICPVTIQNIGPFNNISEVNNEDLTCAALWYTILTHQNNEYNLYDDKNRIIIPLSDIEQSAKELFGSQCDINFIAPKYDAFFEIDKTTESVYVLPFSNCDCYMPVIVSVSDKLDTTVVKVGYVSSSDMSRTTYDFETQNEPNPEKYMDYILKKDSETQNLYIESLKDSE